MNTTLKGLIFFVFALFLIPLVTIVPTEISRAHKLAALKDHGIEVIAQVDGEEERKSKHGPYYVATYHYQVDSSSGTPEISFSGKGRMSWFEYVKISVGGKIPVVYDARNPAESTTKTQLKEDGGSPYKVLMFLLPLLVGAPIAITSFSYLKSFGEKKLLTWGSVAHAKIIAEEEYDIRGIRFSEVTYEFKDNYGTTITGTQKGIPANGNDQSAMIELRLRFLMSPTAIYDPRNSARNILYPPSAAKLL